MTKVRVLRLSSCLSSVAKTLFFEPRAQDLFDPGEIFQIVVGAVRNVDLEDVGDHVADPVFCSGVEAICAGLR